MFTSNGPFERVGPAGQVREDAPNGRKDGLRDRVRLETQRRAWPGDQRIQLDTLTVDGRQVVLRAAVPDLATAQACVAAWQGLAPGGTPWVLATPEIIQEADRVQIIARAQAPAPAAGRR